MKRHSTQQPKISTLGHIRQHLSMVSTTVLLFAFLSSFASNVRAEPRSCTPEKGGLVLEIRAPNSTFSHSGLETGDIITHWEPLILHPEAPRQPDSVFNWFWFVDELLPRGPASVTFAREGKLLNTIVFPGVIGARARPALQGEDLILFSTSTANRGSHNSASEAVQLAKDFVKFQRQKGSNLLCWVSFQTAEFYAKDKNLPTAIEWYMKALDLTDDPLAQIYIWQTIGATYQGAQQPREAERSFQTALAITQAFLPESLIEATSLKGLYLLAWESRDLERVGTYALRENALLVRQAPQSLKLADSWNILGVLASRQGDLDQAKLYHQQALVLRRAIAPDSRDTARSLINLGNLELLGENYSYARSFYVEALAVLQKAGQKGPEESTLYSNLGRVESGLGRLVEAERMYRIALEHTQDDEVGRLSTIRSLSYLAQKRGDFIQAEDWSRQAVETLQKRAPLSSEMADALASLASIRFQMNDLDRARDLFESALSMNKALSRDELDIANGLSNIASVMSRSGDLAGAEALWKEALDIYEELQPHSLSTARTLHNLGEAKKSRLDHETALRLFQRALAIERQTAPFSADTATTLWTLGSTLRDLGRYEEALAIQAESVTISQRVPLAESIQAQALHEESITLTRLARFNPALLSLRSAVDLLEAQAGKIVGTDDNRTQFRSRFSKIYRDYVHALAGQGQEKAAFQAQELFLARSLASLFAERDLIFRDAPPELEASRVRLSALYDLVQQKIAEAQEAKDSERIKDLTRELRAVRDEQNNVISRIRQASPHLASLRHPEPLSVESTQSILDDGTLALSFSVNNEAILLFALMSDGTFRAHRIATGSDELKREVSQFMGMLREQPTTLRRNTLLSQAIRLHSILLGPVDDLIGRSKRILIIPDGPLHSLSFAALVQSSPTQLQGEGRQFLVERRPLHIASSLTTSSLQRSLQGRHVDAVGLEELVAFGDPAYPISHDRQFFSGDPYVRITSGATSLLPLPWSRREVERIAELFPNHSRLYLGNEATEEAAKAAFITGKYDYVHFAGHGYLDQSFPLNSAIVLALPKSFQAGNENGLLQAWEVLEQVRLAADLVVLSACESGLGKEMGGEGLVGLTRAFQYAGARSVIASQWRVSDRTTAEFMVRFYRRVKEGLSKDEALRATQMEFIRGPIAVTNEKGERVEIDASAPYYWAAFQIYGDWQ